MHKHPKIKTIQQVGIKHTKHTINSLENHFAVYVHKQWLIVSLVIQRNYIYQYIIVIHVHNVMMVIIGNNQSVVLN